MHLNGLTKNLALNLAASASCLSRHSLRPWRSDLKNHSYCYDLFGIFPRQLLQALLYLLRP